MEGQRFLIVAGPCMAESYEILEEVAKALSQNIDHAQVDLFFKSSFDKANRSSLKGERGPGWDVAKQWFADIKHQFGLKLLTDVHECQQIEKVAEICDGIQIPAFLCRQTDLLVEAVRSKKFVNIKKGQFMSPQAMAQIPTKVEQIAADLQIEMPTLTERGSSFGYGDLVVDMRSLKIMKEAGHKVLFDVTHSTQKPSNGDGISGGLRSMAPVLARCASSSGYIDGLFIEIHPDPASAKSDREAQLNIHQGLQLIEQSIHQWKMAKNWVGGDDSFAD